MRQVPAVPLRHERSVSPALLRPALHDPLHALAREKHRALAQLWCVDVCPTPVAQANGQEFGGIREKSRSPPFIARWRVSCFVPDARETRNGSAATPDSATCRPPRRWR